MKLNATAAAVAAMLLTAAAATAAPPEGKGKSQAAASCKANVAVVVRGTLAADGAAAPSTLSLTVTGGNNRGKVYAKAAQPTPVALTATTKVVKGTDGAKAKAESLKSGDKVNVQAKACKNAAAGSPLTATRVTVLSS